LRDSLEMSTRGDSLVERLEEIMLRHYLLRDYTQKWQSEKQIWYLIAKM